MALIFLIVAFVTLLATSSLSNAFLTTASGRAYMRTALSMSSRKPIIAGNWKMNTDLKSAVALASELAQLTKATDPSKVDIAVVPPFPFITSVMKTLEGSNIQVGAQAAYWEAKGAFTGAVSASMLASIGCKYCLAGHSEQRKVFLVTDNEVNLSVKKILEAGMIPILCIGETKEEYELGLNGEICTIQLSRDLKDIPAEAVSKMVIAYEPVWAIGTGLTASPEVAQSIHFTIRKWFRTHYSDEVAEAVRIQYGGSVTADTVDELMRCPDVDGALVGGASLTAGSFSRIVNFNA